MSINLTLNCFVYGENPFENTFPVSVNTNEVNTVGHFKDLIKNKQPRTFSKVDSRELKIYKVDIPLNKLDNFNKDEWKQLSPFDEISEIFANQPPQKHIHLIIQQERELGVIGVNQEDPLKMNSAAQSKILRSSNDGIQCRSSYSIATISLQSMITTTTSAPNQSYIAWLREKIKNLFSSNQNVNAENEDEIVNGLSVSELPVCNINGHNICETKFSIVNYCQQHMVNTTTGK